MVQQTGALCEKFRMLSCNIKKQRRLRRQRLQLMDGGKTAFRTIVKLSATVLSEKISHWTTADDVAFHLPASRVFGYDGNRLQRLEKRF